MSVRGINATPIVVHVTNEGYNGREETFLYNYHRILKARGI